MKNETCFKEFAKYASLNVLGMIGLSCYILADTYFIAQGMGADGLAALNMAIPVYSVIHGSGLMLAMGGATRYSVLKSRKKVEESNRVFSHTLYLAGILAVLFVLTGIFGSGAVARLMGAKDGAVFEMTRTYLNVLLLFAPLFLLNNIILCFVRNDGAPQLAMFAMLGGSFSNIILDYIFIFPFRMGILGAVVATCMAPAISLMILMPFFLKKKNQFHFVKCRPVFSTVQYILAIGLPSFVTEMSSGIVIIVFNMIILGLKGNTGVAAYGVIANISLVVIAIYTGIAQGIQPILSRYYGKGEKEKLGQIYKYALITTAVVSAIVYVGVFFQADLIASLFNSENNKSLQEMAVYGMKIYFTGCLFAGYNIISAMYLTTTDRTQSAGAVSILRGFLVIIPMAFVLSFLGEMTGLWLTFPVTEGVVAVIGLLLLILPKARRSSQDS